LVTPYVYRDEQAPPTIKRLIALLTAGYRIREDDLHDADNSVSLEHPAPWRKVKEKSLWVYDEGSVMGGPRVDNTCLLIKPDDAQGFQDLIAATPRPTWWELNNGPFYVVWAWAVIGALMLAGVALIDVLTNTLRNAFK
jgi:hypothetical protein